MNTYQIFLLLDAGEITNKLSMNQKMAIRQLVENSNKILAIKKLRGWLDISLIDAKKYVDNLAEMLYNMNNFVENEYDSDNPQSYDELIDFIKEKYGEIDDKLNEIIDLSYDVGKDEGEILGYKMRLNEERE